MSDQNYYQTLGVERDATPEEIKRAFKRRAGELHPDSLTGDPEKFRGLMEAANTLRDPEKRSEYDAELTQAERNSNREGGSVDFADLTEGLVESFWPGRFSTQPAAAPDDELKLPENDVGLVYALIQAHKAEQDGGDWWVRRAKTDTREWMPDFLYRVVRQDGQVLVYRNVTDWRLSSERDKEIKWTKGFRDTETFKPTAFLSGYFLYGEGRSKMSGVSPPHAWGEYLAQLDSIARKIAEYDGRTKQRIEIGHEISVSNKYTRESFRVRSGSRTTGYEDLEGVCSIPPTEFYTVVEGARSLVENRGARFTPEGVQRSQEGRTYSDAESNG